MYPLDLRSSTIAHTAVDVYGDIPVKKAGDIAYTGYVGAFSYDQYGGYPYGLSSLGIHLSNMSARQTGGDLRWNNLASGLTFGVSLMTQPSTGTGTTMVEGYGTVPYVFHVSADNRLQSYTEYKAGRLTLDGEYRRETVLGSSAGLTFEEDERSWYVAGGFRVAKHIELGSYYSRFIPDWSQADFTLPANHIYDRVATANISLNKFWYVKLEGHFMDGYGLPYSFQGFYPQDNPSGLKAKTDMFVVRTGFYF